MRRSEWITESLECLPFPEQIKKKVVKIAKNKEEWDKGIVVPTDDAHSAMPKRLFNIPAMNVFHPSEFFVFRRYKFYYGLRYFSNRVIRHLSDVYQKIKPIPTERFIVKRLKEFNDHNWQFYLEADYPELFDEENQDMKPILLRLKLML